MKQSMHAVVFAIVILLGMTVSLFAQDSLNVRQVGFCNLGGERGRQLDVVGNFAYVAAFQAGIRIVDISNSSAPFEAGSFDPPGVLAEPYGVAVAGNYAYVEDYYRGMRVVDVSNPASPVEVGSYQHYSDGRGIAVVGNYAYLAADYLGLKIVDISNPTAPALVGSFSTSGRSHYVRVSGNYAYLSLFDPYSVAIIDVSNPSNPVGVSSYPGTWVCMAVVGNYAYMAAGVDGMRILDISNPSSPVVAGNYNPSWGVGSIKIAENYAYVGSDVGLRVLDISDFDSIREVGFYYIPSMPSDNDVVVRGNYAYAACGATPGYGALRIFDCSAAITPPCPPTSLPFVDNFDSPTLDSCWFWIREDTSHWSLTERPGWMRIWTQDWLPFTMCETRTHNRLSRIVSDQNCRLETKLYFDPQLRHSAGLIVYLDDTTYVDVQRQGDGGIRTHYVTQPCSSIDLNESWNPTYLRIDKIGINYTAYASPDSFSWYPLHSWNINLGHNGEIKVGLHGWKDPGWPEIPADFDYFRVDSLFGTTMCGDVSGVWDSTGSPYYVTCDVTVPAGQTLEIRPGVQVLFTGHYKFNVLGNLQAIGTEEDSIVFTRAFPTEESKWWGIRIVNAQDTSRLSYCQIEYGKANGQADPESIGGGLYVYQSRLEARHCRIWKNYAFDDGGGLSINNSPYVRLADCAIDSNMADNNDLGAGGVEINFSANVVIERTQFFGNHSDGTAGAILNWNSADVSVINCTFFGNMAGIVGSAAYGSGGTITVRNAVAWSNSNHATQFGGQVVATYSNVQGGYPGTGNIDADPMFVDTANGDFHLQAESPCIDTGDPNSPLDPDSTRADMGAFPFMHQNLIVAPDELTFGLLDLGDDSTRSVALFNPITEPIAILSVSHAVSAFAVDTTGLNGAVPPHTTYNLNVTFSPAAAGSYEDTLVIVAQQAGDSTILIPMSGGADVILPPVDSLVIQKGPLNGIRLDWAPVTHSISGQPVENVAYIVYGATSLEGEFVPFGYATTNSYVHPYILNTQATYFYQVTADVESSVLLKRPWMKYGVTPSDVR